MSITKLISEVAMENRATPRKNRFRVGFTYKILAALRIIMTLLPQTGYIHPDEYFQSMEIMIGDIFKTERSQIPDYDSSNPYRNIVVPFIFYGLPLTLCKWLFTIFDYRGTISPYFLLVPCRLLMCLLSFLVDHSLISICRHYEASIESRVVLLASSFVMLVFGSRTFSNMIETALFSLLLRVVVTKILDAEKAYPREVKLKASLEVVDNPRHKILITRQLKQLSHPNYSGSFEIATLCVLGFFCRPTFAAFAVCPVFFWLYRGPPLKKISLYTLHLRWACLVTYVLPTAFLMTIADTVYYKQERAFEMIFNSGIKACLHRITECIVITPFNFIRFNINEENQIPHGVHPRWLNLVNFLLLYNILGVCFLHIVATTLRGLLQQKRMLKFDSVTGLMFVSIIVPVLILSMVPHQEPRYIIPITMPLIFLCGPIIHNGSTNGKRRSPGKVLFVTWCILNTFLICFFGFLHQGGVLPALKYLTSVKNELKYDVRIHVLSSHIYTLPSSFLTHSINNDKNHSKSSTRTKVIMYPTSSTSLDVRLRELETVMNHVDKTPPHNDLIYFIFPATLTRNFTRAMASKKLECRFAVEVYIFLHLSTEAMPKFDWTTDFMKNMGLNIVRLQTSKQLNDEPQAGYFDANYEPNTEELYAHSVRM